MSVLGSSMCLATRLQCRSSHACIVALLFFTFTAGSSPIPFTMASSIEAMPSFLVKAFLLVKVGLCLLSLCGIEIELALSQN